MTSAPDSATNIDEDALEMFSAYRFRPDSDIPNGRARQAIVENMIHSSAVAKLNDPYEMKPLVTTSFPPALKHAYLVQAKRRRGQNMTKAEWLAAVRKMERCASDPEWVRNAV